MLKIAARNSPRMVACIGRSNTFSQKYISQSLQCLKKYEIKDHFEFDKMVINSSVPVVVNFHAEWCDPCKILTPKMISMLQDSKEVDLAVINVEDNMELVETFEVKAVPAILAFRNGVVVDKFIGLTSLQNIEAMIDRLKHKN